MSKPRLIIIHGPAGAGKSTIATELRKLWNGRVAGVPQDYFYPDITGQGPEGKLEGAKLIGMTARQLLEDGYDVILEGIFVKEFNGEMIQDLIEYSSPEVQIVYLEAHVDTAVKRHSGRDKAKEFGPEKIVEWYPKSQPLKLKCETIVQTDGKTVSEVIGEIREILGLGK